MKSTTQVLKGREKGKKKDQKKSYIGQPQLVKLVAFKHGISESRSKQILTDTCNYILLSIAQTSSEVGVPRLGTFKFEDGDLKFTSSQFAKSFCEEFCGSGKVEEQLLTAINEANLPLVEQGEEQEDLWPDEDVIPVEISTTLKPSEELQKNSNKPDVVRNSFTKYLKEDFGYGLAWKHPNHNLVFPADLIKSKLEAYRNLNRGNYRALWCLYTTGQSRQFIAENFNFSGSSIKRRWNQGINAILIMLMYPELEPKIAVSLYNSLL